MVLKRVGLTGATGMLGTHIRSLFQESNIDIISISRPSPTNNDIEWDLSEWKSIEFFDLIFTDAQAIIHAGAIVDPGNSTNEKKMYDANVRSCLNLGEWALLRGIPIIYISGAIVYEDTFKLFQNEKAKLGWNGYGGFYGFSKLLAEDIFMRLKQKGLKISILRPTSIYGTGMPVNSLVSKFLIKASNDETIEISEPVEDGVDLIHALDVARAIMNIVIKQKWRVYNLSSGDPISIKKLAQSCINLSESGRIKVLGTVDKNYIPSSRYSLDTNLAKKDLNWSSKIDINLGLKMIKNKKFKSETL
jgi:nucleoside-diphosphate-sugar epimerase